MSAQQDDVPLALRDQFPPEETAVLSGQQAIEQLGPAILSSQPSSNSEEVDNGSEAMIASPSRPWSNLQPSGGRLDMASLGGSLHQGGRPSSPCSQTSLDTAPRGTSACTTLLHLMMLQPGCGLQAQH